MICLARFHLPAFIEVLRQLQIQTKYIVGDSRLTEVETAWLAQEIQDWLKPTFRS